MPPAALQGVEVDSRLLTGANAALILGVSVAPLLSECNAAPIASYLRRTLPLLGRWLGALLWSAAASCEAARSPLGYTSVSGEDVLQS